MLIPTSISLSYRHSPRPLGLPSQTKPLIPGREMMDEMADVEPVAL